MGTLCANPAIVSVGLAFQPIYIGSFWEDEKWFVLQQATDDKHSFWINISKSGETFVWFLINSVTNMKEDVFHFLSIS